jgi:archaellum biogenesis protein FlaJ (TadC family)
MKMLANSKIEKKEMKNLFDQLAGALTNGENKQKYLIKLQNIVEKFRRKVTELDPHMQMMMQKRKEIIGPGQRAQISE